MELKRNLHLKPNSNKMISRNVNNFDPSGHVQPEMQHLEFSSLIYVLILVMGLLANILIFFAILLYGKLTRTKVLLVNVALADFFMLITGFYLRFYDQFPEVASKWLCRYFNSADVIMLQVSVIPLFQPTS